jgi:hypothetical protein
VLGAEAAGERAVLPRDQQDLGAGQIGQLGPVTLLGQHRHAKDE